MAKYTDKGSMGGAHMALSKSCNSVSFRNGKYGNFVGYISSIFVISFRFAVQFSANRPHEYTLHIWSYFCNNNKFAIYFLERLVAVSNRRQWNRKVCKLDFWRHRKPRCVRALDVHNFKQLNSRRETHLIARIKCMHK